MEKTQCSGCATHKSVLSRDGQFACTGIRLKAQVKCPCAICLIKMVCQKSCDEYDKYKYESWMDHIKNGEIEDENTL